MGSTNNDDQPRFSFGSMALTEEPGRGPLAIDSHLSHLDPDQLGGQLNETLDKLRTVAVNEYFCPEILPFETETIQAMSSEVKQQTELVEEEEDESVDALSFESQLKRMEIDRINYLLRHYYRMRIKKIEGSVLFIFKDLNTFELLSKHEQNFATGYMDLVEEHFKKSFLSMLPKKVQVLDKDGNVDHATGPNLHKFVFCKVKNSVGSYAVGEEAGDETLDLNQGDILCIRYKSIQQLLMKGDVDLI
ncbi:DNA replication complex GINS protein sld5 [Chondrus crispus]|uniref:DNA replication complex GINS protein SLD5 n=1 Tax=Chondrus crispus TaxID=2769 RepID=R7Q402_CHOCR|nr:DNA replication complex GINS protein sld5 [Chondrus crispus]CDF32593.1 DNA replication complex GINS protein sld5 [Chondrus crispus]|eukprot:XP_005712364.1 DNA replication complex GINS protein sld5 [Chondrus crispus]